MTPITDEDTDSISIFDIFRQKDSTGCMPINLTVGNPNLPPPPEYYQAMQEVISDLQANPWNGHGYAVAEDPFGLCKRIAENLRNRFNVPFEGSDICISVGATGALDVIFKTLLSPEGRYRTSDTDNEVIILAPYFVEYINIVRTNLGTPVIIHTDETFNLDINAIESAISGNTKVILINSPNNPTGTIYSHEELQHFADLIKRKEIEFGHSIYVIEDSVYDTIHYTDEPVPSLSPLLPHLFRVNSWSKSISLAGERIGYFAMHPDIAVKKLKKELFNALFLHMRMRVVHAPLLQHRVLSRLPVECVTDISYYHRNIETLYSCLKELDFTVQQPEGTFYLWAILPAMYQSELHFRMLAKNGKEPLLYLPGVLFGGEKYKRCIRFSACVSFDEIIRACRKLKEIASSAASSEGIQLCLKMD